MVQLVDGWFLGIEVGEATQVWEKHLSFLYGYVKPYFCVGLSGLCLCFSSAFSSVSNQSCAAEAVWECFCFVFPDKESLFCLLLLRSRACVLGF